MDEFALGWVQHHFSFPGMTRARPVPGFTSQIDSFAVPPWHSFTPASLPPEPTADPQISSHTSPPPSEPSSDTSSPAPEDEACLPDPGPVEEPAPDWAARAGYIRLLLATESHRRELQRRRRAEQPAAPLQLSADTERLRQREMRLLYGAAAGRVAAAESRAQLEFDTVSDRHRPPLWPNIPLKIRFA